jgi:2-hydroxycyclohexanecarboxyl-CoA dehydrogenase
VDLQLAGDNAVIVGAAQGIGHAIATAFAAEGANVALWDIHPSIGDVAAELDSGSAGSVSGQLVDVTDGAAVESAATEASRQLGQVHHLVYTAGVGSGKHGFPFWKLDPGDWPRVLDVNLVGAVRVVHAFVQPLIDAGRGSVLLISSVAGQVGSQTDPPYSAAKAGLINFTQCAARDLAGHGIRVNSIAPGMIKTALNRSVWEAWYASQNPSDQLGYEEWAKEKIRSVAPLGRWQEAKDVAQMAVMLASEQSRNITGQTINVDGGQVMH